MQAEAKKRGYNIFLTAIAQAVVEGVTGTSLLARQYHNYWGLKCGKSWRGDNEFANMIESIGRRIFKTY